MNIPRSSRATCVGLSFAALVLSACDAREEDEMLGGAEIEGVEQVATESGAEGEPVGEAEGALPFLPGLAGEYAGTYLQRCLPIANRGPVFNQRYGVLSLYIADNGVTATHYYYADGSCSQPSTPATVETNYRLSFPEGVVATSKGEAEYVNLSFESLIWAGTTLGASDRQLLEPLGFYDSVYDILLLEDDVLYFGEGLDKSTPDDRPERLDNDGFVRQ